MGQQVIQMIYTSTIPLQYFVNLLTIFNRAL